MGVLGNPDNERFCQVAHTRIWAGEKRATALPAAYVETVYRGETSTPEARAAALKACAANARRLTNRKDVAARLAELAAYSAKLAGIDAGWSMVELKILLDEVKAFNLDDYMTDRIEGVPRFYDISRASREQIARLSEMTLEEDIIEAGEETLRKVRKTKLAGPKKAAEIVSIIALMARIGGWEAPKKVAPTNPEGTEAFEHVFRWKTPADAPSSM